MPPILNRFPISFPTIPASLSTGSHETRDHFAEQERTTHRPTHHSLQDITPYLGLRSRLSQVWINRWTVLLLLILVRVLIAIGSLNDNLDSAKIQALSACSTVESMGSAMASLPYYMSQGTNELAAMGVEKAVGGLESMLFMAVTAFEEIFVFVVNMIIGTYSCLITLAVGTAAEGAIAVAEDVTRWLNDTMQDITGELSSGMNDFEGSLNDFLGTFNNIFNGGRDPPQINLDGSIDRLHSLQIPTDVQNRFNELRDNIPNYDEVRNRTEEVLRLPFELIKEEMRDHLGNFTFNQSAFPVPARRELSFCSEDDGINSFFEGLYDIANTARKVFIAVLVLSAILVCVPIAWLEIKRWHTMQERAQLVKQKGLDPMDVIYIASRPHTAGTGLKVSHNFTSAKKQILTRWIVAYCTSAPALVVLSLALAGLFSCLCQYVLLQAIRREVPSLVSHIGEFTDQIVSALDEASFEWSNGTNSVILQTNDEINDNLFGWVNTSTSAVNETLDTFIEETTGLLNNTFGNTPLYEPIQGVFDCLIGLKVEALQRGLTWARDHAHIDFPLLPNDTFSTGAARAFSSSDSSGTATESPLSDPGSSATDKITEAILKLTDKLVEGIRTEALISTSVLLIYIFICLCSLGRALFLLSRHSKTRGEGGFSYSGDIPVDCQPQLPGCTTIMTTQQTGTLNTVSEPVHQEQDLVATFRISTPRHSEKDHWINNQDNRSSYGSSGDIGTNTACTYGIEDEKRAHRF